MEAVAAAGFDATPISEQRSGLLGQGSEELARLRRQLAAAMALTVPLFLLSMVLPMTGCMQGMMRAQASHIAGAGESRGRGTAQCVCACVDKGGWVSWVGGGLGREHGVHGAPCEAGHPWGCGQGARVGWGGAGRCGAA